MRVTFRRNLKPPTLPVDNSGNGYTVQFRRVKVGCVFKTNGYWYIKRDEERGVINGTYAENLFRESTPVWVTDMDFLKPIPKWGSGI